MSFKKPPHPTLDVLVHVARQYGFAKQDSVDRQYLYEICLLIEEALSAPVNWENNQHSDCLWCFNLEEPNYNSPGATCKAHKPGPQCTQRVADPMGSNVFASPVQLACFFPSTTMAIPTMSTSHICCHMPEVPIARADLPLAGPDLAQDAAPTTDTTPPAEVAASVPTKRAHANTAVKKVNKDKDKTKEARARTKQCRGGRGTGN
ncbi:hypothetical protein B0H14DRAFT_2655087 [Mycena olivaceomarginata]|nr:hypothetical protein B0H14DRAFT_2655087 [Mycena olivaceomarginata]